MARSDFHGWTLPSGVTTSEAEWLAVENNSNCLPIGCIVQEGYDKATEVANGCTAATGGAVKQLYYAVTPGTGGNNFVCHIGSEISSGEGHNEKVARCNSSDWCFYLDGDPQGGSVTNSGIGSTAPYASIFGEFTCNVCMDSGTQMRAEFGTDGTTGRTWQVSAASDDTGYQALTNGDVSGHAQNLCGGSPTSVWNLDPVATGHFWEIYSVANGVHC